MVLLYCYVFKKSSSSNYAIGTPRLLERNVGFPIFHASCDAGDHFVVPPPRLIMLFRCCSVRIPAKTGMGTPQVARKLGVSESQVRMLTVRGSKMTRIWN